MRRPNTNRSDARGEISAAALCIGGAALMLIMGAPIRAHGESTKAAPAAAGTRQLGAPPAPTDSRSSATKTGGAQTKGAQNGPFGMLKFSADKGPIQIKAGSLNLDYKGNSVEFSGGVHATQSGTTLTSKSLKVIYGSKFGDIKQVIAVGDVKMSQGGRWATGQRAVLDEVKHTVEMTGAPVIHDGPDSVAGTRIIIYLDSEKSFVEHAAAVIFPNKNGKSDHEASD